MNCDEYRNWVQVSLDGDAVEGDDLAMHLAACPGCRLLAAAAAGLQVGLRCLVPPPPPAGLAERITVGVMADRRQRRRRRRLVFAVSGLAAAAAVVLAVLMAGRPGPNPPIGPQVALTEPRGSVPPDKTPPAASLNDNMAEAGTAVESLVRRTADETVSSGQILMPSVSLPMPTEDAVTAPLEPSGQSLREAGHGVAAGLQPVADSAVRAFDLFRRDLPPMSPEAKSGL